MVKIVVLDGYTLNPGDLDWEGLKALGNLTVYDRTPPSKVLERSQGAEMIFVNKVVLNAETMQRLAPTLKFIGVLATGYNVVDIDAASSLNIVVSNIPTYGTFSVSQMTFAHILNIVQNVGTHAKTVTAGKWTKHVDWCYWDTPLVELSGKTMGVVGFGRIGQTTATMALAFGMKVVAFDIFVKKSPIQGVQMLPLDEVFKVSDVISLHCNLTEGNKGLINKSLLGKMKKNAILINTSRGTLVNEPDLAEALNNGVIAAAGLDVLSVEPPKAGNPLLKAKNCFITPHISWATKEARARLMGIAVDNARAYLDGKPVNDVRPTPTKRSSKL